MGAFAYPHDQGSQVYFQEQAIGLRGLGAEVDLLVYGARNGSTGGFADVARWRALDGFRCLRAPAWSAPHSRRSGPRLAKLVSDLGLLAALHDALASKGQHDAGSDDASVYDAVVAHHLEACVIAATLRTLRPSIVPPIVYCAHTLLGQELPKYLKRKPDQRLLAIAENRPRGTRPDFRKPLESLTGSIGEQLDHFAARQCDRWIALTRESGRVMNLYGPGRGRVIRPGLPDPHRRLDPLEPERVARSFGLEPKTFVLYSGNLDGYQELRWLADAARLLDAQGVSPRATIAVASHSRRKGDWPRRHELESTDSIRFLDLTDSIDMLSLMAAARATIVTRRSLGGFPIKLANSLAVGTPPIAFHDREWGLEHEVDAWIADPEKPAESLANAIALLGRDDALAARLAAGARRRYETAHGLDLVAGETLDVIREAIDPRARRPGA